MGNFLEILKELRLFIAILISSAGAISTFFEWFMENVYLYNIHLMIFITIGVYANHFLSTRRHKQIEKRVDVHQGKLNELILENSRSQLKAEVRQAFKDYYTIEVIDFQTTIKYLQALDERRKELGVNSYTEDMMRMLLAKTRLQ